MQPPHSGSISTPGSSKTWTWKLYPTLAPTIMEKSLKCVQSGSQETPNMYPKINKNDIIFDSRVLEFIGQKLEKKYIKEIVNNKMTLKKEDNSSKKDDWTTSEDNKLIALYKRNVPEFALSKILKKSLPQIRERIMLLMKK